MQWNRMESQEDVNVFLKAFGHFHDSCVKELRYISGAFVGEDRAMMPFYGKRELSIVFQRQFRDLGAVELVFTQLHVLHLAPDGPDQDCLLGGSLFWEDGLLYWVEGEVASRAELPLEAGEGLTWLAAEGARWRELEDGMGNHVHYGAAL